MALYIDVGLEDVLRIGDTFVALERKSGTRARLKIIGKSEVELMRKERIKQRASPGANPVSQTDEE
jgi:hypothetical protein